VSRRIGCRVAWSSTRGLTNDPGRFAAALAMKDVGLWPPFISLRSGRPSRYASGLMPARIQAARESGGGRCRFAWWCMARITSVPSSSLAPKERQGGRS
jgi:hypothetical protein